MGFPGAVSGTQGPTMAQVLAAEGAEEEEALRQAQQADDQDRLANECRLKTDVININNREDKKLEAYVKIKKVDKTEVVYSPFLRKDLDPEGFAEQFFAKGNPEYKIPTDKASDFLKKLSGLVPDRDINVDIEPQALIDKIIDTLSEGAHRPDPAQVDKFFEFLEEATKGAPDPSLHNKVKATRVLYYNAHAAEVDTGHKVMEIASQLTDNQGANGVLPETLNHLREIIHNPQDAPTKFKYYKSRGYDYDSMEKEFYTIFHYVGDKFKDAKIPRGELHTLINETRTLQAILNMHRFFKKQMPLMYNLFEMQAGSE